MSTLDQVQCPYCATALKKPQRKTKCKACGGVIYLKKTPTNPVPRLMTEAQAQQAEAEWSAYSSRKAAMDLIAQTQIPLDEYEKALADHQGDSMGAIKSLLTVRALAGDRNAILYMCRFCLDTDEHEHWRLLLIELDLAQLASKGIRRAQLSAHSGTTICPVCKALDQHIIDVHDGARAVIPAACSCNPKGSLSVHAWIKRPDGTGYVDWEAVDEPRYFPRIE